LWLKREFDLVTRTLVKEVASKRAGNSSLMGEKKNVAPKKRGSGDEGDQKHEEGEIDSEVMRKKKRGGGDGVFAIYARCHTEAGNRGEME